MYALALLAAVLAVGPTGENGQNIQPTDQYGLQRDCTIPVDGGTYHCNLTMPALGYMTDGGWVPAVSIDQPISIGSTQAKVQAPSTSWVNDQGTAGGIPFFTQDGMCINAASCQTIDLGSYGAASAAVTIVSGQSYDVVVSNPGGYTGNVECYSFTTLVSPVCGPNDAGCVFDAGASCSGHAQMIAGEKTFTWLSTSLCFVQDTGSGAVETTICPISPCR